VLAVSSKVAKAVCYACALVSSLSYLVLIGTPGIHDTIGWPLFGVHMLSATLGVVACLIALIGRHWSCIIPGAICAYTLAFQLTELFRTPTAIS
jgi:hypothetical protein